MAFYGGPRGPPPPPWQVVVAPGQPRPYYYNPVTNVTTWEPPPEATAGFALTRDPTAVPGGIPPPAKAPAADEAAKAAPAGATPATAAGAKTKSVCVEA